MMSPQDNKPKAQAVTPNRKGDKVKAATGKDRAEAEGQTAYRTPENTPPEKIIAGQNPVDTCHQDRTPSQSSSKKDWILYPDEPAEEYESTDISVRAVKASLSSLSPYDDTAREESPLPEFGFGDFGDRAHETFYSSTHHIIDESIYTETDDLDALQLTDCQISSDGDTTPIIVTWTSGFAYGSQRQETE